METQSLNHWTAREVPPYTYIKPLVEQLDATTSATHAHTHTFFQNPHTLSAVATYDKYSSNPRGVFKTKLGTAHVTTKNISKTDYVSWK